MLNKKKSNDNEKMTEKIEYNNIQLIMADTNTISNKEALKEKIHEIHNTLRNNGAGYGMNALKVFNILFGLKKIEEKNLIDKVGLQRPYCEFSYLLNLANENKGEEICELILGKVLDSINNNNIKNILFYEIPRNIKGSVYCYLIKEIDKITKIEKDCNVLLSGKIYEYFIGRDESAISELGAYFTDRHITSYIYKKLDPSINKDGSVPSMIDMYGGSGGFTTGYINYLIEKYKNNEIDWNTEINKIHHYDINEDVIKSAGLEFFCLTGVLPNMNNLKYKNSFTDEFGDKKYTHPITNPPYGGDKNKNSITQEKRTKIKKYIKNELQSITDEDVKLARQKQLKSIEALEKQDKKDKDKTKVLLANCSARIQRFAKNNKLIGSDKEACSLILLMDIVDIGGTAVGVLKEGVFFDNSYKDLRKCLIENYNVREVISIPHDQFENTKTKTSIIIFDNTVNKTIEVKFSDLIVERYENDKFVEVNGVITIIENKGDISGVSDAIVSIASKEEILSNSIYSLDGKVYNNKKIECGEGYELVKLGNICKVNQGTYIKADMKIQGEYPVYGGGNISYYINQYNREDEIIIAKDGISIDCVRYEKNKFFLNHHAWTLICKEGVIKKYLFYYLQFIQDKLYSIAKGSAQLGINQEKFYNVEIPIPKSEEKIKDWVDKITKPYDEKYIKENKIKELEEYIINKIKNIEENELVRLGDICEINQGNSLTKKEMIKGIYDVIGGGKIIGKHNQKNRDGNDITLTRVGDININYINKPYYLTDNGFSLKSKQKDIITKYIYYFLSHNINYLTNLYQGTAQKVISKTNLKLIKIPIPKSEYKIEELETTFLEIEQLKNDVEIADELYKKLIKDLSEEAMPNIKSQLTEEIVNIQKNEIKTPSVKSSVSSTSSLALLKEQAKSLGIKGLSKYKKEDKNKLIKLIEEQQ
jgi:restriction endonuclease S subunit